MAESQLKSFSLFLQLAYINDLDPTADPLRMALRSLEEVAAAAAEEEPEGEGEEEPARRRGDDVDDQESGLLKENSCMIQKWPSLMNKFLPDSSREDLAFALKTDLLRLQCALISADKSDRRSLRRAPKVELTAAVASTLAHLDVMANIDGVGDLSFLPLAYQSQLTSYFSLATEGDYTVAAASLASICGRAGSTGSRLAHVFLRASCRRAATLIASWSDAHWALTLASTATLAKKAALQLASRNKGKSDVETTLLQEKIMRQQANNKPKTLDNDQMCVLYDRLTGLCHGLATIGHIIAGQHEWNPAEMLAKAILDDFEDRIANWLRREGQAPFLPSYLTGTLLIY